MTAMAVVLLSGLTSLGQVSSDELARAAGRERDRRARIEHKAPVIENEQLEALRGVKLSSLNSDRMRELAAEARETRKNAAAAAAGVEPALPVARPEQTEAFWRDRMEQAAIKADRLARDVEWTKQKVMLVRNNQIVPGEPLREFNRKVEHDQLLAEQSQLEASLAAARLEPDRIREEARRAGVPPGWLR